MSQVSMEKLMRQSDQLKEEISRLTDQRQSVDTEIAQRLCPFKVGDHLVADHGPGTAGLVVAEVYAPQHPCGEHRWVLKAYPVIFTPRPGHELVYDPQTVKQANLRKKD